MNTLKLGKVLLVSFVFFHLSCSQEKSNLDMHSESIALEPTGETLEFNSYEIEEEGSKKELQKKKDDDRSFETKIIKNANCRLKVKSVEEITKRTKAFVALHQGYVADERFTHTNYSKENRFVIRVPKDKFNMVLDSVCKWAEFVDHKNVSTVDVTEEYMDVSSRLKTRLEVKERYEAVLRSKAKTVEDILKAEDKIKDIQEEVEAAKGRIQYLSNKVSFSTIQIDLYEAVVPKPEPTVYEPSFVSKAKEGFSFGWSIIQNATLLLFYIWPIVFLAVLVLVYFKWIRK